MRCAFDMSAVQIYKTGREEDILIDELLQLRTPLTQYAPDVLGVIPYILDNGAYSHFDAAAFERMAQRSLINCRLEVIDVSNALDIGIGAGLSDFA